MPRPTGTTERIEEKDATVPQTRRLFMPNRVDTAAAAHTQAVLGDAEGAGPPEGPLCGLRRELALLFEGGQSLDSVLVKRVANLLEMATGGRPVPRLMVRSLIALSPMAIALVMSPLTGEPIAPSLALLAFTSVAIFLSLVGLAAALRGWRSDADAVLDLLLDLEDLRRTREWVISAFDLRRQARVALCFACCFLITAAAAVSLGSYRVSSFVYVSVFLAALLPGNGFYWGIVSPRGVSVVCASKRLKACSFDPSATLGINRLSNILGTHSVVGAVMIVLGIVAFLYLGSQHPGIIFNLVLAAWLVIGAANELYVFVYPQYRLYQVISRHKRCTLDDLRRRIDSMYSVINPLDKDTLAAIREGVELYNLIKSTRSTPITIGLLLQQVSSTFLPLLAYVAGELDWRTIASAIAK
jgi:hypothetical protein